MMVDHPGASGLVLGAVILIKPAHGEVRQRERVQSSASEGPALLSYKAGGTGMTERTGDLMGPGCCG